MTSRNLSFVPRVLHAAVALTAVACAPTPRPVTHSATAELMPVLDLPSGYSLLKEEFASLDDPQDVWTGWHGFSVADYFSDRPVASGFELHHAHLPAVSGDLAESRAGVVAGSDIRWSCGSRPVFAEDRGPFNVCETRLEVSVNGSQREIFVRAYGRDDRSLDDTLARLTTLRVATVDRASRTPLQRTDEGT